MNASEVYTRLVGMRNTSGDALYERLKLAKSLLVDRDWVENKTKGGGNESIAIDRLESECFGDTGMSLPTMIFVLDAVPDKATWKANKFNLRRMHAEMKARQEASKPKKRPSTSPANPPTNGNGHAPKVKVKEHVRNPPVREDDAPLPAPVKEELEFLRIENMLLKSENAKLKSDLAKFRKLAEDLAA